MAGGFRGGTNSRRSRDGEDIELDITPMIDVTFLLLIFFMVTSTMQPENALKIPPAKTGVGVETENAIIVTVFNDDGTPGIYLADAERKNGPVPAEQVTGYVEQSGKPIVIIKADRTLPFTAIEEVARAAAEVERVEQFFFAVQEKH